MCLIKQISNDYFKNNYIKDQWENLLLDSGIQKKQIEDFQHLDQTLGIYHKEKLVGTVSYQNNVIKYIAVSENIKMVDIHLMY